LTTERDLLNCRFISSKRFKQSRKAASRSGARNCAACATAASFDRVKSSVEDGYCLRDGANKSVKRSQAPCKPSRGGIGFRCGSLAYYMFLDQSLPEFTYMLE